MFGMFGGQSTRSEETSSHICDDDIIVAETTAVRVAAGNGIIKEFLQTASKPEPVSVVTSSTPVTSAENKEVTVIVKSPKPPVVEHVLFDSNGAAHFVPSAEDGLTPSKLEQAVASLNEKFHGNK